MLKLYECSRGLKMHFHFIIHESTSIIKYKPFLSLPTLPPPPDPKSDGKQKLKDCGLRAFCYQKLLEALEPMHFQHVLNVSMIK